MFCPQVIENIKKKDRQKGEEHDNRPFVQPNLPIKPPEPPKEPEKTKKDDDGVIIIDI